MARRRRGPSGNLHATLYDFRDLDLMLKIEAEANPEGWIEAADLADGLGFGEQARPVSMRLNWMRRYGMVEYDERNKLWRVSDGGRRVTEARLRASAAKTIEALPDEAMIEVMANVTSRYWKGDALTAHLLRREFLYGTRREHG
jgi:hypothetical protein